MENKRSSLKYVLSFIGAMVVYPIICYFVEMGRISAATKFNETFENMLPVHLMMILLDIVVAIFVLFAIWTVVNMIKINKVWSILPIALSAVIIAIPPFVFTYPRLGIVRGNIFEDGLLQLLMLPRGYFTGLTVVLCFAIAYLVWDKVKEKKVV